MRPESLPLYAGNISETQWGHEGRRIKIASIDFLSKNAAAPAGELFGPNPLATEPIFDTHAYSYRYDALQRLVAYEQYGKESLADSCYVERGIAYDGNGNVLTLERTADGRIVDRLNYTYDGNRLVTLDRNGTKYDYAYDANGNCIKDGLNNLQITYNFLNLLEEVTRDGALMAGYVYAADGVKLSVRNASGYGYDYSGSLVYGFCALGHRVL